jgi:hypothetical protein
MLWRLQPWQQMRGWCNDCTRDDAIERPPIVARRELGDKAKRVAHAIRPGEMAVNGRRIARKPALDEPEGEE